MKGTSRPERAWFTQVYHDIYVDLLHFVERRLGPDRAAAEDVVAEALTTAWRRADDLPATLDEARAWIFGIARHQLLNDKRSNRRRVALGVRVATHLESPASADHASDIVARLDLARAWQRLSEAEQEVLALTFFDDLDSASAARVLGLTAGAYRMKLTRAKRALADKLREATPAAESISGMLSVSEEKR